MAGGTGSCRRRQRRLEAVRETPNANAWTVSRIVSGHGGGEVCPPPRCVSTLFYPLSPIPYFTVKSLLPAGLPFSMISTLYFPAGSPPGLLMWNSVTAGPDGAIVSDD